MKIFCYILFLLLLPLKLYSQSHNSHFPSRIIYQELSPQKIAVNGVGKIMVTDHWLPRLEFQYDLLTNRDGVIAHIRYNLINEDARQKSKSLRVNTVDTVYYNRTNVSSVAGKDFTAAIGYTQNGKISRVSFYYKTALIGSPVKSVSFSYNQDGKIKEETLVTCSEIIKSVYQYDNSRISNVGCMITGTDNLSLAKKADTLKIKYMVDYYPSGLLKSIVRADDTARYIKYCYTFKK